MTQILPLRRRRIYDKDETQTTPIYGDGIYITADDAFIIQRCRQTPYRTAGWYISRWSGEHQPQGLSNLVETSGLLGLPFKRRCDAIKALEMLAEDM